MLPKITATITIVETNEVVNLTFPDVVAFVESLTTNISLAELTFGRKLTLLKPEINGNVLKAAVQFDDNGQVYMRAIATRHDVH